MFAPGERATTDSTPEVNAEQRVGVRRALDGVTITIPGDPRGRWLGAASPVSAHVVNLSVTGAAIVLPDDRELAIGTILPVVLDGVAGEVRVRRRIASTESSVRYHGVSFVTNELVAAAAQLLRLSQSGADLAGSLIELLDELAGWIQRTATWSDDEANLQRLATDLSGAVARLSKRTPVNEIIANVCWIECAPGTTKDLHRLDQWSDRVNQELGRFPHDTKRELARALIALGGNPMTSPLGHAVLPALAESLLI